MHWQLSDYYGDSRNLNALETDLVLFILECKENPVNLLLDKTVHCHLIPSWFEIWRSIYSITDKYLSWSAELLCITINTKLTSFLFWNVKDYMRDSIVISKLAEVADIYVLHSCLEISGRHKNEQAFAKLLESLCAHKSRGHQFAPRIFSFE